MVVNMDTREIRQEDVLESAAEKDPEADSGGGVLDKLSHQGGNAALVKAHTDMHEGSLVGEGLGNTSRVGGSEYFFH